MRRRKVKHDALSGCYIGAALVCMIVLSWQEQIKAQANRIRCRGPMWPDIRHSRLDRGCSFSDGIEPRTCHHSNPGIDK